MARKRTADGLAKPEPYKPDPPTIRMEGPMAQKMMVAGHMPGDMVDMHVRAKVTRAEARSEKPKERWDPPQHSMHLEIQQMTPRAPKAAASERAGTFERAKMPGEITIGRRARKAND